MPRILHVLPRLYPGGGIESFFMNYYRHMDSDEFHIDVICHEMKDSTYADEIRESGGSVTVMPQMTAAQALTMPKRVTTFFEKHNSSQYDIVHCNMANAAYMYLAAARRAGVPVRILHSHQSKYADKFAHKIRNVPLVALGKRSATHFVAASRKAGDFLFGAQPYTVIPNAIDSSRYHYSANARARIRQQLNIAGSAPVIGCVGRMTPQKNQHRALEIVQALLPFHNDLLLLFLGDGDMLNDVKSHVHQLGMDDHVRFLGNVPDVTPYYSAMDALLMPSIYEGLPVTLVEAQAAGLPSLVSSGVSEESKLSDFVTFKSLDEPVSSWAATMENKLLAVAWDRGEGAQQVAQSGYGIVQAAKHLEGYYRHVLDDAVRGEQ